MGILHSFHERRLHKFANKSLKAVKSGNTDKAKAYRSKAISAQKKANKRPAVKPQHKVSVTMSVSHHVDANPHGIHQAQLNDAQRALASSVPYNPRAKKKAKPRPRAGTTFSTPVHAKAQKYYG